MHLRLMSFALAVVLTGCGGSNDKSADNPDAVVGLPGPVTDTPDPVTDTPDPVTVTPDPVIEIPEPTFLEGQWVGPCEDVSEDSSRYGQSTFTFSGLDVNVINRTYDTSGCEGSAYQTVLETNGKMVVGDEVVLASGQTATQFVVDYFSQTAIVNTQAEVDDNNSESYCGYSDWTVGVAKDVLTCRFDDGTKIYDIALVDGSSLYFGDADSESTYPTQLDSQEDVFTKL